jgi:hypothetical protein
MGLYFTVPLFFEVLDLLVLLSKNNALEHDGTTIEDLGPICHTPAQKKCPSLVIGLLRSVPKY